MDSHSNDRRVHSLALNQTLANRTFTKTFARTFTKSFTKTFVIAMVTAAALIAGSSFAAGDSERLTGTVNINTATAEELQLLPGIGESRANALIAMRKSRGGFKSVAELTDVKGIGEAALAKLRPFVRIEGKTTARRD